MVNIVNVTGARVGRRDGTSNTIAFGETGTACYTDVRVAPDIDVAAAVPAPPAIAALLSGLAALGWYRRRRR